MKELTIHYTPAEKDAGARVRVSYKPEPTAQAQERETDFDFSVTDKERQDIQWYLEEYLVYPWGEFRTRAVQVEQMMLRLGAELFTAALGNPKTYPLYAHIADELANTRIIIHANDPEGIALPWELMRDPEREYCDLARLAHAFVRSQPNLNFEPPPAPEDKGTFNILMVICRPGGPEGDVPFQSVARPLLELFRPHRDRIRLDILRPPTYERLSRVLSDKPNFYHVLHFDGHGAFPQGGAGTHGLLLFEGEGDEPRRVTGAELGGLLAGKGLPVVLLNACQSGMTHPEAIYPSVGNELLKAGTRGVVAMAYSVYVQSAVRFMARLYESLIKGDELSRAVSLAREDLRSNPQRQSPIGEIPLQDWVVPVLFEAAPVSATSKPVTELRLNLSLLQDEQAKAGAEIDLPEPPAFGFVGRDGVTLDLERAFRTETIVLLEGMAGVGKTEMAAGFARWWAETGALDGPIFFFHFEHYLPLAQVFDRVGQIFTAVIKQQLNVEWNLLNPDQRRQVALSILKQVPCMLIWDNFEPVAGFPAGTESIWKPEEQKELRDFLKDLQGGKTKVLITSRRDERWIGNIYRRVQLSGLKLTEAQELAVHILQRAGLNPRQIKALPQYNDLLEYLRGNPLAIQALLPELKRTKPDALLGALQAGEVKLSEDDPAQGRERSLSASLTYRLDALDTTLRQRLGLLALFQGFVDTNVLTFICQQFDGAPDAIKGLGRDEWMRMLDAASEIGLLRQVEEGRYTVHPALPWFFHDLLCETFSKHLDWLEQAFSATYCAYSRELFEKFMTDAQLTMSLLRLEESNLMHALRLGQQHELWYNVEGLLYGLQRLFVTQGRWVEWERLLGEFEVGAEEVNDEPPSGRMALYITLESLRAEIAKRHRDFDTQRDIYLRLKDYYETIGSELNLAQCLHQLGTVAQQQRNFEEAERWYRQSLDITERINAKYVEAQTLHNLGMIAKEQNQFEEAERLCQASLSIKKSLGDEHGQASTLCQLGMIAQELERFEDAKSWYLQSLDIGERVGDEEGRASILHLLGRIATFQGQFDEAERWHREALLIVERTGEEFEKSLIFFWLGLNAEFRQRLDEAERWYQQCLAISERFKDEHIQLSVHRKLGEIAAQQEQLEEAERHYLQCLALSERIGNDPETESLHALGMIAQLQGRFDEAERWFRQSLAICERIGDENMTAFAIHQLGRIAEERGNLSEAARLFEQAEELLAGLNDPHNLEVVRAGIRRVRGTEQQGEAEGFKEKEKER